MESGPKTKAKTEASTLPNPSALIPMDRGVGHLPGAVLSGKAARRLRHGGFVPVKEVKKWLEPVNVEVTASVEEDPMATSLLRVYDGQGRFLGVGRTPRGKAGGVLQPVRLLPSASE